MTTKQALGSRLRRFWPAMRNTALALGSVIVLKAAVSQAPTLPAVDINLGPLTVATEAANIALALSVEFPTVGAAYRGSTYNPATTYLGYWDSDGCYAYKDTAAGAPIGGEYFFRTGTTDADGSCNTPTSGVGYSGNLMNYVASSAIDILRYALTGGNRVVDTSTTSVLERAYLFNGWGLHNGNFPARRIPAALVGKVMPSNPLATGDVYAGSCLDRVWFGTSNASANCDNPGLSGNLNYLVANPSSTNTVSLPAGSPAPAFSQFITTSFQITSPLQTTTVEPTSGPVPPTFNDRVTLATTGTTTVAPPSGTTTAFLYTSWTPSSTSTISPTSGGEPVVVVGTTTQVQATRVFFRDQPPGAFRTLTFTSNSINVCRSSASSNPANFAGRLTGAGAFTSVGSSECGSGVFSGLSNRGTLGSPPRPAVVFEPLDTVPVYQRHTAVPVYRAWSVLRVYDVYELRDSYIVFGTRPGRMFARVRVCDSTEAASRSDLCLRYPSGNYKPVGEIQRKAFGARVAAFGYLAEDNNTRQGGVLRAPMSYVGPRFRDSAGTIQTNSQAEWDETTGVFASDPRGASPTFALSGVINYLNKFGTTGTPGYYKTFDPVGELYFEALRYFMGQPPTASKLSGLSTAAYDGYPLYDTAASTPQTLAGWTDPVQNSCQRRNYILTIGDVNTWHDGNIPGHGTSGSAAVTTEDPAVPALPLLGDASKTFNVVDWTRLVTGFETGANLPYTDALGRAQNTTGNPSVVAGNSNLQSRTTGAGGAKFYWAGAAYWANTQPIRFDTKGGKSMNQVRVKSFVIDVDEPSGIPTNGRSFYLAGKYGWFNDANLDGNPFRTTGGVTNNTEWQDPEAPNTPDGYVLASQARRMIDGIRKFFAQAASERSTITGAALSSQRFTARDATGAQFSPLFNPIDWTGTIVRQALVLDTSTYSLEVDPVVIWNSSSILTTASLATTTVADPFVRPADRKIFTMAADNGTTAGQAFTVANKGNLDAAVRAALNTDPATGATDSNIDDRINWIRGVRSKEVGQAGGYLRARSQLMGDIINSGPVFKKGADPDTSGPGYAAFTASVENRVPMVYVGANAGMLHGFRATDGKEMFAYIPRAVATNLHHLTRPSYVRRPFVDGLPAVGEARIGTTWKTVLASGMGGGAQGVFALDVTDPANFGADNVLFEFTDRDDPDMGSVLTAPRIVKMRMAGTGTPVYKWFIAVGSGYNNYVNDGFRSTTGRQALFLLSLDKAPGQPWTLNTNYFKVVLSDPLTTSATGLGNPGFATGPAGEAIIFYAGDLQGNLWRFDFQSGLSATNAATSAQAGGSVQPFAVSQNDSSQRQPITMTPLVDPAPYTGYMVQFGTGKFMEPDDTSSASQQSIYGIFDRLVNTSSDWNTGRNKLLGRTITNLATMQTSGSETFVLGSGSSGTYRGWYIELPSVRERITVAGASGFGYNAFASVIPDGDCSGDGRGGQYCVNPFYGTLVCLAESPGGIPSSPTVILVDDSIGDHSYSPRSATGRRTVTIGSVAYSSTSKLTDAGNVTSFTSPKIEFTIPAGRASWREIRNFRE